MHQPKRSKEISARDALIYRLREQGLGYRCIAQSIPLHLCDPPITAVRCHQIYHRIKAQRAIAPTPTLSGDIA